MNKILVTGGAGFIGSNFINYCIQNNNQILNYDLLTYAGNLNNLKSIENSKNYQFVKGDICDRNLFSDCLNTFKPNYVVHFAAESHVDRSIDNPHTFINTNIVGTSVILDECLNYYEKINDDKFRFLHISTDEVFGSLDKFGKFTEKTPYDPSSPYSASKASADHLVNAWYKTYSLPTIITNCSNNFGPFQFPEKLIPLIILSCFGNRELPVYGDGSNIRDWLYVEDHCKALYLILEKGKVGETYNIGGNQEKSNLEVVHLICDIMDDRYKSNKVESYRELINFVDDRPSHDFRYAVDTNKIKNEIDWSPLENFNSGLIKTIKWYNENNDWINLIIKEKYNLERLGRG